jgi:hypothetical protein
MWSVAIADSLSSLGHTTNIKHSVNACHSDVELIHCPLLFDAFEKKHFKKYIMIQGEQFPTYQCSSKWQMDKWLRTRKLLHLYDLSWDTYQPLHAHLYESFPSTHFKIGYHQIFDNHQTIEQKYDISFFGTMNERRNSIVKNLNVEVSQKISDKDRSTFINKSKINLNIHYSDSKLLQSLRVLYIACNKAFILSEDFIGDDDLRDRIVNVDASMIPEMTSHFLKNKEHREDITNDTYEYFKSNRTMLNGVKNCL